MARFQQNWLAGLAIVRSKVYTQNVHSTWPDFHCVVPDNIHSPPSLHRGQRKFRGEGGDQKEAISEGVGGCLQRFFFPGDLSKIDELLIHNSFSVEQTISYFTVTGVSKQVLLFALIIFYLRSAKCFFHGLRESFL